MTPFWRWSSIPHGYWRRDRVMDDFWGDGGLEGYDPPEQGPLTMCTDHLDPVRTQNISKALMMPSGHPQSPAPASDLRRTLASKWECSPYPFPKSHVKDQYQRQTTCTSSRSSTKMIHKTRTKPTPPPSTSPSLPLPQPIPRTRPQIPLDRTDPARRRQLQPLRRHVRIVSLVAPSRLIPTQRAHGLR